MCLVDVPWRDGRPEMTVTRVSARLDPETVWPGTRFQDPRKRTLLTASVSRKYKGRGRGYDHMKTWCDMRELAVCTGCWHRRRIRRIGQKMKRIEWSQGPSYLPVTLGIVVFGQS